MPRNVVVLPTVLFRIASSIQVLIPAHEHEPIFGQFQIPLFKTEHIIVPRFGNVGVGMVHETESMFQ